MWCVVETGERTSCRRHKAVRVLAGYDGHRTSGFLASVTTEEIGLGSSDCPWVIETQSGQRINLTLHNFAAATVSSTSSKSQTVGGTQRHEEPRRRLEVCFEVAVVAEPAGGDRRPVSVCSDAGGGGGGTADVVDPVSRPRSVESVIAVSQSNELRVEIVNRHMLHTIGAFLVQFKGQHRTESHGFSHMVYADL